jgi:arylsulfatase A-like enzyme
MGFNHFEALQDLKPRPQPLGYLAGDDQGAVEPLLRWVKEQKSPFMATVLTSASHHTYDIPDRLLAEPHLRNAQSWPQPARYMLLVHEVDRVLQRIVDGLKATGRGDNLAVIVLGDHGEAFGEHGGFQHDNIFTESGLHVPFALHYPPRVQPGTIISENRSLLDTTPTILQLSGISFETEQFDGRSLLSPESENVRRYFSCWYTNTCVGVVENNQKLVFLPTTRSWLSYDLASDPGEIRPLVEAPERKDDIAEIQKWYAAHRHTPQGLFWSEDELFGGTWICRAGQNRCRPAKKKTP